MKEEKIIVGEGTQFPLNGILCLPDNTEQPVPAAVFVHGSGSSDMNEHIRKLYPFKDLAEGLAAKGIASIRYDKRTFAHGRKMLKTIKPLTVYEETIEDAVLASDLLKKDPRIDADRVYIIGHSMGACLAGRIDHEGGDFAGLIMMAGSLEKLEDILIRQMNEIAAGSNALVKYIINKQSDKLKTQFAGLYDRDPEELKTVSMGGGTSLYYFREMGDHPAASYLENTDKPVLVMQGEKDFQVRADRDYKGLQQLLADKENVTFRLYPGLSHLFVTAISSDISKSKNEYSRERHIPADVINDIADWIHGNA